MAWQRADDKQLPELMMFQFNVAFKCHSASITPIHMTVYKQGRVYST